MKQINSSKLHAELQQAGIPIEGVSSDGRIDFLPIATEAQQTQAMQILATHDPVDYEVSRWSEYPDMKHIVLALLTGGQELAQIKAAIEAVNKKYSA